MESLFENLKDKAQNHSSPEKGTEILAKAIKLFEDDKITTEQLKEISKIFDIRLKEARKKIVEAKEQGKDIDDIDWWG